MTKKVSVYSVLGTVDVIEHNIDFDYDCERIVSPSFGFESPTDLFWCNDKNLLQIEKIKFGTVIASAKIKEYNLQEGLRYIIVSDPRAAFASVLRAFFMPRVPEPSISATASIAPNCKLGENVFIGHNVVIEENCVIGSDCIIMHNTVILEGTIIGNRVSLGSNNTIGGVGFGYVKNSTGNLEVIPHIGNVLIEDHVEIGNNTCIDRAVIGSTCIGAYSKIDNHVHIAHGVTIGKNSLIIAHAMIGGSTKIEDNCWIAPGALIINKCTVGSGALVGMGAVVIRDVSPDTKVAGSPAKEIQKRTN